MTDTTNWWHVRPGETETQRLERIFAHYVDHPPDVEQMPHVPADLREEFAALAEQQQRAPEEIYADMPHTADLADAEQAPERRLVVTPASTIKMRSPKWLYDLLIPLGFLTLLAGREGIGKSTISYDFIARITNGRLPGQWEGKPKSAIVYATEDAWESVIVPRLVAAGADLDRVLHVEAVNPDGTESPLSVPADLERLAEVCEMHDVALLVLDPLMSAMHASLDTHKEREIRQALDPLARFARDTNIAVIGLIHANKSTTTDPLNSIMGSRAFTAVARAVLYCIVDPEADEDDRYLLGHPKCSLGPKQPSQKYHLITAYLETDDGDKVITSKVVWDGQDERTIRDLLEVGRPTSGGPAADAAAEWLGAHLKSVGSAAPSADVKAAGKVAGHSERSLKRALTIAGIDVFSEGMPRRTYWSLPAKESDI